MEILKILEELHKTERISTQAYRTYIGQIKHGDESACILGLERKHLIERSKGKDGEEYFITRTS